MTAHQPITYTTVNRLADIREHLSIPESLRPYLLGHECQFIRLDTVVGFRRTALLALVAAGSMTHDWTLLIERNSDCACMATPSINPSIFSDTSTSLGSGYMWEFASGSSSPSSVYYPGSVNERLDASSRCNLGHEGIPRSSRMSAIEPTAESTPQALVTADVGPEQKLTRRQRLQRRMPPRSVLQAIIDRGKGLRDPWLDDEND